MTTDTKIDLGLIQRCLGFLLFYLGVLCLRHIKPRGRLLVQSPAAPRYAENLSFGPLISRVNTRVVVGFNAFSNRTLKKIYFAPSTLLLAC